MPRAPTEGKVMRTRATACLRPGLATSYYPNPRCATNECIVCKNCPRHLAVGMRTQANAETITRHMLRTTSDVSGWCTSAKKGAWYSMVPSTVSLRHIITDMIIIHCWLLAGAGMVHLPGSHSCCSLRCTVAILIDDKVLSDLTFIYPRAV
jgi:hypothetical protein